MDVRTHKGRLSSDRLTLCQRVADLVPVTVRPTHLLVDFDDYSDQGEVLDEFRGSAFAWTRDQTRDRWPKHWAELLDSDDCMRVVWMSGKVAVDTDTKFVWVLAHELRHIDQQVSGRDISRLRQAILQLRLTPGVKDLPPVCATPPEIDAELFALQSVAAVLGDDAAHAMLASWQRLRHPSRAYSELLAQLRHASTGA